MFEALRNLRAKRGREAPTVREEDVLSKELDYIQKRRTKAGLLQTKAAAPIDTPSAALALSGGGIRSAVYCLGVLQKLAAAGVLEKFDYLSTVSGGGYIGGSLTWFLHRQTVPATVFDCGNKLPFGIDDPTNMPLNGNAAPLLKHLKHHGSYLIPGKGVTVWSGIAVVLRGILLNLLIWVPMAAVTLLIMAWVSGLMLPPSHPNPNLAAFLWLAGVVAIFFLFSCLLYSWLSGRARNTPAKAGGVRYASRRLFESWITYLFAPFILSLLCGTLPLVDEFVERKVGSGGLPLGSVMSIAGAALGMWTRFGEKVSAKDLRATVGAPIGALLFLYGTLLMSWSLTAAAWHWRPVGTLLLCLAFAVGLFSAHFVNLNYLTLHRYYRDRLMEAFLPNLNPNVSFPGFPATANTFLADQGWLKNMADKDKPNGPYHLINTHVVLNDTKDPKVHQRGGDSFLLSPYYCGSKTTGWLPTDKFLQGEMTVATAMAISGAAVNPDAAGAGVGPQRNKAVSLLMALLNIRLGCWVPRRLTSQNDNPTHFTALGEAVFGCREDSAHLLLTDGGHFDNLGVYELIRRRVCCVLACDATADPGFQFSDLQNLIVRVESDFGVKIQFADMPLLGALMPSLKIPYPKGMELSKQPFIIGSIIYPKVGPKPAFNGVFIYLTTLMTANLRLQLYGFKGANPAFPDETTANQFFSEARFEAYRELGWTAADQMLTALANSPDLACCKHIFAKAAASPSVPVNQGQQAVNAAVA